MSNHMPLGGIPTASSPTRRPPATGDAADPYAGIAPACSTVVTMIAEFAAVILGMLSPMACDSCSPAEADRFGILFLAYFCALLIPLALLLASWLLPWRKRNTAKRIAFAVLAPCSAVAIMLIYLALLG